MPLSFGTAGGAGGGSAPGGVAADWTAAPAGGAVSGTGDETFDSSERMGGANGLGRE
jgi:hypothetical protein